MHVNAFVISTESLQAGDLPTMNLLKGSKYSYISPMIRFVLQRAKKEPGVDKHITSLISRIIFIKAGTLTRK